MEAVASGANAAPLRVAVLIDWQNVYKGARDAFGLHQDGHVAGNVDPWQLARVLAAAKDPTGAGRGLQEVRIYRGMPDQARDEATFRAFRSQTAEWKRRGGDRLSLKTRKIKYPPPHTGEKPREKGIDVWLAIDLVEMAIRHRVDRAVVVSTDTDLIPALRLATETRGDDFVEVVGWEGLGDAAGLLYVPGRRIRNRPMRRELYEKLHDNTDYTVSTRSRAKT